MPAITDADTFAGFDGKGPRAPDSASGAEAAAVSLHVTDTDSAAAADAAVVAPPVGTDAGFGSTGGESVQQTGPYPDSDLASGTEASPQFALSNPDTGSGAEAASVFTSVRVGDVDVSRLPPTTPADADGGSGADTSSIAATLSGTDTGTGVGGR